MALAMSRVCPECRALSQDRQCAADRLRTVAVGWEARDTRTRPDLFGQLIDPPYTVTGDAGDVASAWLFGAAHPVVGAVGLSVFKTAPTKALDTVAAFYRASRDAMALGGAHVMSVEAFAATEDGLLFRVLEYAPGEAVGDAVARLGPFRPQAAVRVGLAVAEVLRDAHARRLLHRNISDRTVRLCRPHGAPVTKVLGVGLTKLTQDLLRDTDAPLPRALGASLTHVAPEVVLSLARHRRKRGRHAGPPVGPSSDLYALGALLYQLLTGAPPFHDEDPDELLRLQVREPAPPLPEAVGGHPVPKELRALVDGLLHKDPAKRPVDTAEEVMARLATL